MKHLLLKISLPILAIAMMTACEKESFTTEALGDQTAQVDLRASGYNFHAVLSGDNEVPPNESTAAGVCVVKIAKDESSIDFKLIVSNADSVTASHFHMAPAGQNGGVVVTLYPGPTTGQQNGILAEGTIMAGDVTGSLAGDLNALIEAIRNGMIYVNVHSMEYPGGEVRGQVD